MAESRQDRINKLSKRFSTHAVGRPPTAPRTRDRHSFYLDTELIGRLDQAYRQIAHELYPHNVSKSTFLETILEYGLVHLEQIKAELASTPEP